MGTLVAETPPLRNPYLDEVYRLPQGCIVRPGQNWRSMWPKMLGLESLSGWWFLREQMVRRYALAIPSTEAICLIAKGGAVVEIGAGTGYWAWLLRQAGVDVLAYDSLPVEPQHSYFRVERSTSATVAGQHPDRTLFLCWPPFDGSMAEAEITAYAKAGGRRVFHVGEMGGTSADVRPLLISLGFRSTHKLQIPQWWGLHDFLAEFHRD